MLQSQINVGMQQIFNLIYPVGSLYFSTTMNSVTDIQRAFGGTWERLPEDYAIWTASQRGGETIRAGVPRIMGRMNGVLCDEPAREGSLSFISIGSQPINTEGTSKVLRKVDLLFNASNSSDIYRDGVTTVQPPAYRVYVFKRTALSGGGGLRFIIASIMLALKRRKVIC